MSDELQHEVTQILHEWSDGDADAPARLMPLVYDELRRQARSFLAKERGSHTLQPTALVHEAYLRLVDQTRINWQNRAHFFGLAANMMRRVLVDHARAHATEKRGGAAQRLSIDDVQIPLEQRAASLVALDEALEKLAEFDRRGNCRSSERFKPNGFARLAGGAALALPRTVRTACGSGQVIRFRIVDCELQIYRFQAIPNPKSQIPNPKSLRGDLDNIVLKALKKDAPRRYSSVEQFAEDIRRHLTDLPVVARPDTPLYRATKFVNRNRVAVFAGLLIFLTLIGGIIATVWQARRAEANRVRAEKRFNDVRQLSNALLADIAPKIERLPGSTEARQALVSQSLKYLDSLANESLDDLELQAELAGAYEKVADLQGNPGKPNLSDFAGAIASYGKANLIRRSLPFAAENQLLLAENFRGLANVRYAQNDIQGTLQDYAAALEIHENLLTKEPDSYDLQTTYLKTKFAVAEVYVWNNQYGEAVPRLREIIAALERFAPNRLETRRFLATVYAQLGNSLSWDDKQPEAEIEMAKAVAIAERLAAENPNDTDIRQHVFKVYVFASSIYENINDEISLQFAHKALQLAEKAVERDAADVQAKQNLANSFSGVGNLSANLKRFPEAVSNLEKSEKIYLELLERDPTNQGYRHYLGILFTRFGDAKQKQGDLQGALQAFQKSADYFELTSQTDEKNLSDRRNLVQSLKSVGNVYLELGEEKKAKENFQRALEILNQLEAQNALGEWDKKLFDEVQTALQKL